MTLNYKIHPDSPLERRTFWKSLKTLPVKERLLTTGVEILTNHLIENISAFMNNCERRQNLKKRFKGTQE